jgi:pyruvate/2-oxoglutarate dehydrogenase complex dihydrolipoamide acyltransferase (E2) component
LRLGKSKRVSPGSFTTNQGDSFVAGDVLLEIETDKAQMDVEAQDDGVLAKIVVPDGTQKVNVGNTIAVLAEEGDDISNVQVPAEDTSAPGASKTSEAKETALSKEKPSTKATGKKSVKFGSEFSPAVSRLLTEYGIENPKSITATGPQGRLLKGDILAHVGSISSNVIQNLEKILEKKQHLDLSNIKVQQPPKSSQQPPSPQSKHTLFAFTTTIPIANLPNLRKIQEMPFGLFRYRRLLMQNEFLGCRPSIP